MKTTTTTRGETLATRAFQAFLILGLYYMWYRYPFKINSDNTSPSYSDTPAWLQEGKYELMAAILVTVAVFAIRYRSRFSGPSGRYVLIAGGLLALLAAGAVVRGLWVGDRDTTKLGVIFGVGVALTALNLGWTIQGNRLVRVLSIFAVVVIVVDVAQIVLYVTTGRLPALAYAQSISIRFGSLLDDPNGLAFVIPLLLATVLLTWKRVLWRAVAAIALVACLVLTQSLTGMAACVAAALIGTFALSRQHPRRFWVVLAISVGLIVGVVAALTLSGLGEKFLAAKAGSLFSHSQIYTQGNLDALTLWGLSPKVSASESSYLSLILQFGLPLTLVYCFLGVAAIVVLGKTIRQYRGVKPPAIYVIFFYFLIAFLIGSINLRLSSVFPLNLLYVMGIALSVFAAAELKRNGEKNALLP